MTQNTPSINKPIFTGNHKRNFKNSKHWRHFTKEISLSDDTYRNRPNYCIIYSTPKIWYTRYLNSKQSYRLDHWNPYYISFATRHLWDGLKCNSCKSSKTQKPNFHIKSSPHAWIRPTTFSLNFSSFENCTMLIHSTSPVNTIYT